jgi:hypothetical protein
LEFTNVLEALDVCIIIAAAVLVVAARGASETLVNYQSTWCNNPEGSQLR